MAGLEGHVCGSAVYLVHKDLNLKGLDMEGLGPTPRGGGRTSPPGVYSYETGCYHMRSVNVL